MNFITQIPLVAFLAIEGFDVGKAFVGFLILFGLTVLYRILTRTIPRMLGRGVDNAIAKIQENRCVTVNHNSNNTERRKVDNEASGFWTCPKCTRINQYLVKSCACGQKKPSVSASDDSWTCKFCGKINPDNSSICYCGHKKAESRDPD